MIDITATTTLLLDGLAEPGNETAWRELDARYRPLIEALARKIGLSPDQAADAAQDTLLRFLKAYRAGQYDRQKGRLRSWIIGILKNRVADIHDAQGRRRELRGESALSVLPSDDRLEQTWDEECERQILRRALNELRENTKTSEKAIAAFEMLVWQQVPVDTVAKQLGMTPHDIYMAKRRVTDRLKDIVSKWRQVYSDA